ncbi:tetratricopeptide repeat protein [Thauera aromatica]|nr:SEL1-like repeat protein [Thauera aromatica]
MMKRILVAVWVLLAAGAGPAVADLNTGQRALDLSDYPKALAELRPLAERGNSKAQFLLGKMYTFGWGVAQDKEEGLRWYREAASRGLPEARALLIRLCERDSDAASVAAQTERLNGLGPLELLRNGRSLCAKAALQLEARLEKDPAEATSRYRLLGYYYFNAAGEIGAPKTIEARRRHILWLIAEDPGSELGGAVEARIAPAGNALADPQGYAEGSRLWLQQVDRASASATVFAHAAAYHQIHDKPTAERILLAAKSRFPAAAEHYDASLGYLYALAVLGVSGLNHTGIPVAASPQEASSPFAAKARKALEQSESAALAGVAGKILSQYGAMMQAFGTSATGERTLAEKLLTRAERLQPGNPLWAETLGQHLLMMAKPGRAGGGDGRAMQRALGYLEKSLAQTGEPEWRMSRLQEVAKLALKLGEQAKAERYARELLALAEPHPQDEKYGPAWHDGHMVMGQLALQRGSVAEAREHLRAAGETAGGGTLTSFGPNMGLARDLLQRGEKQAVIDYLRQCQNFWTGAQVPIERWIQDIEHGRTPEFGANLEY